MSETNFGIQGPLMVQNKSSARNKIVTSIVLKQILFQNSKISDIKLSDIFCLDNCLGLYKSSRSSLFMGRTI